MKNHSLLPGIVFLLTGCVTLAGSGPENLKNTWEFGVLYADGLGGNGVECTNELLFSTETCFKNLSEDTKNTGGKFPVVVWLHGCGGIKKSGGRWFNEMGYVTVAPDSFSRRGRESACRFTGTFGAGMYQSFRVEEATYAREHLRKFDWVDQSKVYLAGLSEGGAAAAQHSGKGYRAKILTGTHCRFGLSGPSEQPVLNLNGRDSHDPGDKALCGLLGKPQSSAHWVPGADHYVMFNDFATDKVKKFLAQFE